MVNEKMKIKKTQNKKGEFLIRNWVVAFLIFSSFFALMFVSSNNLFDRYDKEDLVNENYRITYDKFSNQTGEYRGLFSDMRDGQGGVLNVLFGDTGIFQGLFDIIRITFGSLSTLDNMTEQFMQDFGVPKLISNIVFPLISGIIMVLLIFAIISSINRGSKI